MTVFLIILASLLWACSLWACRGRQLLAPGLSYIALLCMSFCKTANGYPLFPINGTILTGWLCITLVVMLITIMEPEPVRRQTRGMLYMIIGALVGLAIGLLGFTFTQNLHMLYASMVVGVIAGVFFGFLLYTNTPAGRPVGIGSGNFFKYLLAKGFPTAITVMQLGVLFVLIIALQNVHGL